MYENRVNSTSFLSQATDMPALRVTRSIQMPTSLSAATASCWAATQNCKSSNGRAGDNVASRIATPAASNLMDAARRQNRHLLFDTDWHGAGPLLAGNRPTSGSRPIRPARRHRPLGVGGQRPRHVRERRPSGAASVAGFRSNGTRSGGEIRATFREPFDLLAETTAIAAQSDTIHRLNSPAHPGLAGGQGFEP